jgi:hypothetical protein
MFYLASQILWLLAIAFVIGIACGWYYAGRSDAA